MGQQVNAVVIAIPTNFGDEQKKALSEAANEAGVEVLQLITEPVAAILAYDARAGSEQKDKFIVVADLGGTRSDISVVASRGGIYSILATSHDYEFAGQNLDLVLIDYFAKEFVKKNKKDPRENARGLAKLKMESEATKKALSLGTNATISIESLADGIDFSSTVNRTRFELLSNKVFAGINRLIEGTVKKAELDVLDIDEVSLLDPGHAHSLTILGHTVRRNFAHTEDRLEPLYPLSAIHYHSLAFHVRYSPQSLRALRPRRRHPSLSDTRV